MSKEITTGVDGSFITKNWYNVSPSLTRTSGLPGPLLSYYSGFPSSFLHTFYLGNSRLPKVVGNSQPIHWVMSKLLNFYLFLYLLEKITALINLRKKIWFPDVYFFRKCTRLKSRDGRRFLFSVNLLLSFLSFLSYYLLPLDKHQDLYIRVYPNCFL